MKKKKIIAMALVAMLSLSGLTGCSDKDKSDFTDKVNNKTSETTKKDDKKSDTTKTDSTESTDNSSTTENTNSSSEKKDNTSSSSTKKEDTSKKDTTTKTDTKKNDSKPSSSSNSAAPSKSEETKPSHTHTWVDHTATKQVPRTVHHDAVYETVTVPAVTKWQIKCYGCGQWFDSLDDIAYHALTSPVNEGCGRTATGGTREVVITPAHTEQKLVKDAWDETVTETQKYVDYKYCSVCGQKK